MFFQKTTLGPWEVNTSAEVVQMGGQEVQTLQGFLRPWAACFPKSQNLAEAHFGTPSSLLRFDYVCDPTTGLVRVYEIEERPAGLGLTSQIHPDFLDRLLPIITEQEEVLGRLFAIYVSEKRDGTSDDEVFAKNSGITLFRGEVDAYTLQRHAWYVRASREEEGIASVFTPHSLSTIANEGNKSYGQTLGFWKKVHTTCEPDFSEAFALKPASGSRFEEVLLWHPERKRESGFATRTKIMESIRAGRVSFLQKYVPPERPSFLDERFQMIRRAYFVWSPVHEQYVSLGGVWVATPSARVHGTREAVSGVLLSQ
jgi:hypothetical protein